MKHRILILLLAAALLAGCNTQTMAPRTAEPVTPSESELIQPSPGLSEGQAQAIALKHAGLVENQVTYLRTALEKEDDQLRYEVQFHHGQWEYHYEIDAETGNILSYDRDD